uniref:Uncharacterized protein n=1 Tax=Micrurus corallinus TaxID=54390 RepID=A0A2D4ETY2_MICCO
MFKISAPKCAKVRTSFEITGIICCPNWKPPPPHKRCEGKGYAHSSLKWLISPIRGSPDCANNKMVSETKQIAPTTIGLATVLKKRERCTTSSPNYDCCSIPAIT